MIKSSHISRTLLFTVIYNFLTFNSSDEDTVSCNAIMSLMQWASCFKRDSCLPDDLAKLISVAVSFG